MMELNIANKSYKSWSSEKSRVETAAWLPQRLFMEQSWPSKCAERAHTHALRAYPASQPHL